VIELLTILTGKGKGKTTTALGLALKAYNENKKVAVFQFIKGGNFTGELEAIANLDNKKIFIKQYSDKYFFTDSNKGLESSLAAWQDAKKIILSGTHQLVVLDEISHALKREYIMLPEVFEFLKPYNNDNNLEIVLTGRNMPLDLINIANQSLELACIKHPLHSGIKSRKGFEF